MCKGPPKREDEKKKHQNLIYGEVPDSDPIKYEKIKKKLILGKSRKLS